MIAANANGFWRARYGGVRDLLIGTRTALADGSVVRSGGRVVKNVAGYDLNKLLVGSLGTLGVIVEATFKVLPLPSARGSGRVERRAQHLRARLATWPARPHGEALMRRVKDAFDPAGILEPGRSVLAP